MVDLRSDTLTMPDKDMRNAAMVAEVGDDGRVDATGRGEDPSVNRLEDMAAALTGKEAALFFPSGTMANLAGVLTHCRRGDTVAVEKDLHLVCSEQAAFMDRFGGLIPSWYNRDGNDMPELASFAGACSARNVRLACLENTHNAAGGACVSLERMRELAAAARERNVPVHLDGARIFNAALALGVEAVDLASCADSVQFCLSKGLGAPVGSLLCGTRDFVAEARETRKLLGGGMRQAGMVAAPGMRALQVGIKRLHEDHENAQALGEGLSGFPGIRLMPVQTNIVMLDVSRSGKTALWFEERLAGYGVLGKAMGDARLRFTTYRGVTRGDVDKAVAAFRAFMRENAAVLAG